MPSLHARLSLLALSVFGLPGLAFAAELKAGAEIPAFAASARDYATTSSGNFAKESVHAEVTVAIKSGKGGNGCAFLGLGDGKPNPGAFGEPTGAPSLVFRLAPNDFAGGLVTASVNGEQVGETHLGDGTHRLRLLWDSSRKCALLEIHKDWKPGATFKATATVFVPSVAAEFGAGTKLFVGGASGVVFSEFATSGLSSDDRAKFPVSDFFRNDATARTWLPVAGKSSVPADDALAHLNTGPLASLHASMRPVVCWYKGANLEASRALPGGKLELPNSKWDSSVEIAAVAGEPDARDIVMTLTLREGGALSAGLAAAFDFNDWSTENYVLIPASVYGGNRNRMVNRGYGTGLDAKDYYRKDLPLTHGIVPGLSIDPASPSRLSVNACNVTTPSVCIWDKKAKRGFILLAEQGGRGANGDFLRKPNGEILDNAFNIEESADRRHATVVVAAPGVRERKPEFTGFSASPDRAPAMRAGDTVRLRLRAYAFAAEDIPALLEKFMSVRKAVTGPNHPRALVPAAQVEKYMTAVIDSRFLSTPRAKFYCPENGPWIAFGWIGGWINTFPMLVAGDEKHLERVTQTFDYGLKAQVPSGYYHYAIHENGSVDFRDPLKDGNLARTTGDMLFWMCKQFQLLKAQGRPAAIKPEWEASMKRLADACVATWKKEGQWGKIINVKTGEVAEYNTTGGAMIIGGLALASDYFKKPEYLAVAKQAADFYYQRDFVKQGQTTGACADIMQNAESETAAGFMTALMALYDVTGDKVWLEKSRNLANLTATWTVSHDYELPKDTELGALGAKLAGIYWASTQNKHGAPGICTSSGDPLLKIYRATGDTRYASLLRDIIAAHGESIRPNGRTNERLTFCDADSRGSRGDHVTGWNETNGILMAQEVPGIYLRTDADRFFVFDSVVAKVVSRGPEGVKVELTNPTKYDANVSVFAENAAQAAKPQGYVALLKWPKVAVKSGETVTFTVTPDGKVK